MLYTARMNNPVLTESGRPGKHLADLKLNAWAIVAAVASVVSMVLLDKSHDWTAPLRAAVALAPLIPSLLYVRRITRFVREMDELQRRIQLEAGFFGAIGTVFVITSINLLEKSDVLSTHGLGWAGAFSTMFCLYLLGSFLAHRRYA